MFSDIGKKIKNLAMLIMFIGCAGSVIYGLICFAGSIGADGATPDPKGVITGILIIVLGVIFSYLSVLVLYGFGTLIDDTYIGMMKKYRNFLSLVEKFVDFTLIF